VSPPSLLDAIDTTVTVEWESTRTIATLVELGGRRVIVTALRAPPTGATVFLRIEREAADAIAVDGLCDAVNDSEWGESEISILLQRVGTTTSAAALREFIEAHDIDRGGTVSVGRNRDNPELKRFVYSLPDKGAVAAGPPSAVAPASVTPLSVAAPGAIPGAGPLRAPHAPVRSTVPDPLEGPASGDPTAPTGVVALGPGREAVVAPVPRFDTAPTPSIDGASSDPTPNDLNAVPAAPSSSWSPRSGLVQASEPDLGTDLPDGFSFSEDDLLTAIRDAAEAASTRHASAPPTALVETTRRYAGHGRATATEPAPGDEVATRQFAIPIGAADGRDDSEEILVNTVAHDIHQAAPVHPEKSAGLVGLLFGRKEKAERAPRPDVPVQSAAQMFTGEFAQRMDVKVQFEVGAKKRKVDGTLLRLSDSKLRVRAGTLPEPYDRITVWVPGRSGPKDVVALRCEVTRVHAGDGDPAQSTFDARLSAGGNPPATMARLRELMTAAERPHEP